MTPASAAHSYLQRRCRYRSSPPAPGFSSHPAGPGTVPTAQACASSRKQPVFGPQAGAGAELSWPLLGSPRRGQCVAYSFDEISHPVSWTGVRDRVGDKRVLDLVKAFLKSGHPLRGWPDDRDNDPALPRWHLSPLLAMSPSRSSTSISASVGTTESPGRSVAATGSPTTEL